ncbi:hypothetical protein L915_12275 [Phytophthora nicotianae]|uniref:C2 domain-containing protein n=1 Tax=Phytophthora nicotianae TaxID=4792 RepID=W2GHA4_PHYNI|nr:hypothetical protein L915_12275 [Phytophthora nicotianae]ETL35702.1 hypothetical protein L916_12193 [Phytophthora nicotianae]
MVSYGQDTSYTLFVNVQSAQELSTSANAAFCTTFLWNTSSPGGPAKSTSKPKYTSFSRLRDDENFDWSEELQLDGTNPQSEVFTVRVKDSSDTLVGSCNVYLAHLHPEQPLDQWFRLHPAGHIHLKLELRPKQRPIPIPVPSPPYSMNEPSLPSDIAMMLELQKQAQLNTMAMVNEHLRQQQQAMKYFMPFGVPAPQSNLNKMIGTAATIAAGMQGEEVSTSGLGTIASIGLGALGLGPFGAFFGA